MTLIDPHEFDSNIFLLVQSVDFPQVLALPERQQLSDGDAMVYKFPNGYGALVIRSESKPMSNAFQFCVLDCTHDESFPTYLTHVAPHLMFNLSYEQVAQLLSQAEQLPIHAYLAEANRILSTELF